MKIRITADGRTLYVAELVTLFRCEGFHGAAELLGPAPDELTVSIELGDRDLVLEAIGLDRRGAGGRATRRLEISTPARLPTDDLHD